MTTPRRPATAYSVRLRAITRKEQTDMAITLMIKNMCVIPHGTKCKEKIPVRLSSDAGKKSIDSTGVEPSNAAFREERSGGRGHAAFDGGGGSYSS